MLKQHLEPPLDRDEEVAPPTEFGSTEKSLDCTEPTRPAETNDVAQAVSPIDVAFAACRAVGGGHGVFGNTWMDRLLEVVQPSYTLLCLTHDKPAELARLAHLAEIRFTAATEKNLALLCVKLAARPKENDQVKICSDWSALLRCAHAQNISPDAFIAWVGTTTVRACKNAVAKQQRAAENEAGTPPRQRTKATLAKTVSDTSGAGGAPRLQLHLHGANSLADEVVELPAAAFAVLFEALTAPDYRDEFLKRLPSAIQNLAVELAEAKGHVKAARALTDEPEAAFATTEVADD